VATVDDLALSAVVDRLDHGVWLLDPNDGTVLQHNAGAAAQIGAPATDLTGLRLPDLVVPHLSVDGWRLLTQQVPCSGAHRVDVAMTRHDGSAVPVGLTLSNVEATLPPPGAVGQRGSASVIVAVTVDLSAQAAANERAAGEHELLDRALDAVADGVAVIGRDGRVEQANETFTILVDLPHEQLVDRSVFDPPWSWLDADGAHVHPEATPPAHTMRTGERSSATLLLPGTGRTRAAHEHVPAEVSCVPVTDLRGAPNGAVLVVQDRSEVRSWQERHDRMASTDPLTGLATRAYITDHLTQVLAAASGSDELRVGVLHVDLDDFRSINDTFGTTFGDAVLAAVADRLRDLSDRHVQLGRVSVDEFLVVLQGAEASLAFDTRLRRLGEEIQRRTEQPLLIDGLELRLTASVGISRFPANARDAAELVRAADTALTAARREGGRHQLRFYERSLDERTRTGLALDRDLRRAAAQRTLEVHYQPIIDLRSGEVAAAEALVRWHHPEHGPIPPSVFIPTAEATGAISAISDMVVTTVAEDVATWNVENLLPPGARIAINISATEFEQRGFVDRLASTLDNAGVSPSRLELEITETLLMRDMETTAARLTQLDELGFLVALDDFGTGYSSLSYLHTLPLHTLKVDRCFVTELGDGRSETITRAILSLAQGLGIGTVGEGVETDEQRRFLLDAGCDLVQGFFYAPPLPREAFERFLRDHVAAPHVTLRAV
jgi:diguanylate cyclase (GGDEF)-like protein